MSEPDARALTVRADTSVCQGHQLCQGEAPDVFGFDEAADVVVALASHPAESLRHAVTHAVRYCPAFALSSEARRVGNACARTSRPPWSPYHYNPTTPHP